MTRPNWLTLSDGR